MVCSNSTCLNGGVCLDGLVCSCPPGWENDFVGYYHGQNCSLPSNFLQIFFIVYTIVTLASIALIVKVAHKARKLVQAWKNFYVVWLVVDWAAVLAVYAENGFYVAACVLTAIYSWVGVVVPALIMMKILQSYFKLVPSFPAQTFMRGSLAFLFIWNLSVTGILLAAAGFARSSEQDTYNKLLIAWFITQGAANVIFLVAAAVFLNRLKSAIARVVSNVEDASPEMALQRKETSDHAIKRLSGMTGSIYGILPFSSVNIIVGILLLAIPSVPYLWILWFFWMTGPVQNLPNALMVFKEFVNKTDSKAMSGEKNSSKHGGSRTRTAPQGTGTLISSNHPHREQSGLSKEGSVFSNA